MCNPSKEKYVKPLRILDLLSNLLLILLSILT